MDGGGVVLMRRLVNCTCSLVGEEASDWPVVQMKKKKKV
jgi:hypothetical protein